MTPASWFWRACAVPVSILALWGGHTVPSDVQVPPLVTEPPTQCMDGSVYSDSIAPPGWTCTDPLTPLLRAIGGCESGGSPTAPLSYLERNHYGSSATGAYQILRGTWRSWQAIFRPDLHYREARDAPPGVQDEVAMDALHAFGTKPWNASRRCWS